MKKLILLLSLALATQDSFARRGENDVPGREDGGGTIVCKNKTSGETILTINAAQPQSETQFSDSIMDLTVKARGHNITEILLTDKRSGDVLKVKRLEELLKITLTSNEDVNNPSIVELHPHQGHGEGSVTSPSGEKANVISHSRKSVTYMDIDFVTNEAANESINIRCDKVK